jgi:hypothetical protein
MCLALVARAWWPAVGAQLERGVRRQHEVLTDKACWLLRAGECAWRAVDWEE